MSELEKLGDALPEELRELVEEERERPDLSPDHVKRIRTAVVEELKAAEERLSHEELPPAEAPVAQTPAEPASETRASTGLSPSMVVLLVVLAVLVGVFGTMALSQGQSPVDESEIGGAP